MKVTRIAKAKILPKADLEQAIEIANRLSIVRKQTWQEFCSLKGVDIDFNPETARDMWMARGQAQQFNLPARLWKQTQRDVIGDIKAYYEGSLEKLKDLVEKRIQNEEQKHNAYWHIWIGKWIAHPKLHRWMRKLFKHGHTQVDNQISLDSGSYNWLVGEKNGYLEIQGLEPRQRIKIPLDTSHRICGTIRLIIKHSKLEVHYTIESLSIEKSGSGLVGLDKGYTEVFTDSSDRQLGKGLGKLLSSESEHRKIKGQRRNKLRSIAQAARELGDNKKAERIEKNNLGNLKWDARQAVHTAQVKTIIYRAVHQACFCASRLYVEDLTGVIKSDRGKNTNRRLSGWVKGLIASAIESVGSRCSVEIVSVNAAFTSQVHHACGCLGRRMGERFYCAVCRVVESADGNAARTIKQRPDDREIGRWDAFTQVREVLLSRTALRLGLLNHDSRHVKGELLRSWREFIITLRQPESELPLASKKSTLANFGQ